MRKIQLLAAALAVAAAPAAFAAQGDAPKAAPAKPAAPKAAATASPEEIANFKRGVLILRTFNTVLQNKDVKQPVKARLMACLYEHNLKEISTATARVFDQNPTLKKDDASQVYKVASQVCGITYKPAAPGAKPGDGR